jgi:hypothetical protein
VPYPALTTCLPLVGLYPSCLAGGGLQKGGDVVPRIVSQCCTADFKSVEQLALSENRDEAVSLPRKQKLALVAVYAFIKAGFTFSQIYNIKEILFWDDGRWEYRFHNLPAAKEVIDKLRDPETRAAMNAALKDFGTKQ